jgi:hypothetical protein
MTDNGAGCISALTSVCAQITVNQPPTFSQQPTQSQIVCNGDNASIFITDIDGVGPMAYQWQNTSNSDCVSGMLDIPGATNPNYSPPTNLPGGTYYYRCIVSDPGNNCGIITSNCASVTVNISSNSPTNISASDLSVCNGNTVNLTVQGGSLGTSANWNWYKGGCGIGAAIGTGSSVTVNPDISVTSPIISNYYVRAEGPTPCPLNTTCANVQITSNPYPQYLNSIADSVCSGSNLNFNIQTNITPQSALNDVLYGWNSTVIGNQIINGNSNQDTVSNSLIADSLVNIEVNQSSFVKYEINISYKGCLSTFSDSVKVNPTPPTPSITDFVLGVSNANQFCAGSKNISFNITDPVASYIYVWSTDNSSNIIINSMANQPNPNILVDFKPGNYTGNISVMASSDSAVGRCSSQPFSTSLSISDGNTIDPQKIIAKGKRTLMYLDNSVKGYQWGYDDKPDFKPHFINGQTAQVFALDEAVESTKFLIDAASGRLDTLNHFFWVMVYDGECRTKVYYGNNPFERNSKPEVYKDSIPDYLGINLFPNPNNGSFELKLEGSIFGDLQTTIYNSLGQSLKNFFLYKENGIQQFQMDLNELSKGIYFVEVNDKTGQKLISKLIIK